MLENRKCGIEDVSPDGLITPSSSSDNLDLKESESSDYGGELFPDGDDGEQFIN